MLMSYTRSLALLAAFILIQDSALAQNEYPKIKAGLWESITNDGHSSHTSKTCIDDGLQEQALKMLSNMQGLVKCTRQVMRKQGADYIGETECNSMGMSVSSRSVFSGDFSSSYTGVIDTKIVGGPMAVPPNHSQITSHYLGACPADMQPGDIVMSNGQKINAHKMADQLKNLDIGKMDINALKDMAAKMKQ